MRTTGTAETSRLVPRKVDGPRPDQAPTGSSEAKGFTISSAQRSRLGRLYLALRAAGEELRETFLFFEPSEVEGEQRRQRVRQLAFQQRNRRKALAAFNRFFENREPEWVRRAKRLAPRAARQLRESETRRLFRRRI